MNSLGIFLKPSAVPFALYPLLCSCSLSVRIPASLSEWRCTLWKLQKQEGEVTSFNYLPCPEGGAFRSRHWNHLRSIFFSPVNFLIKKIVIYTENLKEQYNEQHIPPISNFLKHLIMYAPSMNRCIWGEGDPLKLNCGCLITCEILRHGE